MGMQHVVWHLLGIKLGPSCLRATHGRMRVHIVYMQHEFAGAGVSYLQGGR